MVFTLSISLLVSLGLVPLLTFKMIGTHDRVAEAWALRNASQDLLFREVEVEDKDAKAA